MLLIQMSLILVTLNVAFSFSAAAQTAKVTVRLSEFEEKILRFPRSKDSKTLDPETIGLETTGCVVFYSKAEKISYFSLACTPDAKRGSGVFRLYETRASCDLDTPGILLVSELKDGAKSEKDIRSVSLTLECEK